MLCGALCVNLLAGCAGNGSAAAGQTAAAETTAAETTAAETEAAETTMAETAAESAAPITLTDQAGRTVTLEKPAERIVSSYYISTALLVALGLEDKLVGIEKKAETRELYKLAAPGLLELPGVGTAKAINVEETAAAEPELVILPAKLKDSAASFEALNIPVIIVNPETQEDFEECLALLSKATGTNERGEELLAYYHEKMEQAKELTKDLDRPSVYLAAGSTYFNTCTSKMYQNDLITAAGGDNVSKELTDGYWKTVSAEEILQWNPEYMFTVYDADYSLDDLKNDPALKEVRAVKEGNVYSIPSPIEAWDYPTPSSVLGVLWMTHILHPDEYGREQYVKEAADFYQRFFEISVTEEQLGL